MAVAQSHRNRTRLNTPPAEVRGDHIRKAIIVYVDSRVGARQRAHRKESGITQQTVGACQPDADLSGGAVQLNHVISAVAIKVENSERTDFSVHWINLV